MKYNFFDDQKFLWPWKTFFMGCVKDSSITHGKFMALNQGNEIEVLDHEKRFMGFS